MGLGDKFTIHNNYFAGLSGYTQNNKLNDPEFEPASSAHKSFFLQWQIKTHQKQTGNAEVTKIAWSLKILFKRGQNEPYPDFYETTWNAIDTLEKGYLDFGNGDGGADRVWIEAIELEDLDSNYTLTTLIGTVQFVRDLTV